MTPAGVDLVVLSDYLVADPHGCAICTESSASSIQVRDGTRMVGPLVVPGVTSCLGCADLHRSDRDAAWRRLIAGPRGGRPGHVVSVAALALSQVAEVIAAVRGLRKAT